MSDRTKQLLALNVGDKVIINSAYTKRVAKVEAITKAGNFKVAGALFHPYGVKRGDRSMYNESIEPFDADKWANYQAKAKAAKIRAEVINHRMVTLTPEQFAAIHAILFPEKVS